MISSVLMLGSSYSRSKKYTYIFIGAWFIYMLFKADFAHGMAFPILNMAAFLIAILLMRRFNGKIVRAISSSMAILIWSVLIDIISFKMFWTPNVTLLQYIFYGILFNYKFVILNLTLLGSYAFLKDKVYELVFKKQSI